MYYAEILIYKLITAIEDIFKKKNKKDEHETHWGIGGK
jgi:hypothetical protein